MSFADTVLMRAFGRPSGLLGTLGGKIMARGNRRVAERAMQLFGVRPGDSVLEIGFGPGVAIELLARAASAGRVAGVDPSEEMLALAKVRNAEAIAAGRIDLRRGVAERLPFEDGSFDKALAVNSMQVWSDPAAGLREVHRVLKPSGCVLFAFTRHSRQPKQGLAERLSEAGFADARLVDLDDTDFCALGIKPRLA